MNEWAEYGRKANRGAQSGFKQIWIRKETFCLSGLGLLVVLTVCREHSSPPPILSVVLSILPKRWHQTEQTPLPRPLAFFPPLKTFAAPTKDMGAALFLRAACKGGQDQRIPSGTFFKGSDRQAPHLLSFCLLAEDEKCGVGEVGQWVVTL